MKLREAWQMVQRVGFRDAFQLPAHMNIRTEEWTRSFEWMVSFYGDWEFSHCWQNRAAIADSLTNAENREEFRRNMKLLEGMLRSYGK